MQRTTHVPIGGQAVIEGVMIRGGRAMAIAVRAPDGRIVLQSKILDGSYVNAARRIPFVRGITTLFETFALGIRALYWSSQVASGRPDTGPSKGEIAIATFTLTAAAAVFVGGPVLATDWVSRTTGNDLLEVAAEGTLRVAMLIGYIWFVGRLPEVQRVFSYHGAEHRAIHAHEHGRNLTVDNVRAFANEHPRCGTAFLLTVGVLSMGVFAFLGQESLWQRIAERAALTPMIGAVAYEFIRATQSYDRNPVMRLAQLPNLWLQKLTTRDPEPDQIEVAIAAINTVLALEAALPQPSEAAASPVGVPIETNDN